VAAREREDHRVVALQLAKPARSARIVGQLVVGKGGSGHHVSAQLLSSFSSTFFAALVLLRRGRGSPRQSPLSSA
jgi:hypothetical protein